MKKILTLLFFCCFVAGLSAQEETKMILIEENKLDRFEVGIGINPIVSSLFGNDSQNAAFGIMLNYSFSDSLSHGLRFGTRFLKINEEAVEEMRTSDLSSYLYRIGYYFTKSINDKFNVYLGFDFIGENVNSETTSSFEVGNELNEFISSNITNSYGGGPILGLGYNYRNLSLRAETTMYYLSSKSSNTFTSFNTGEPESSVTNRRSLRMTSPSNLLLFIRF